MKIFLYCHMLLICPLLSAMEEPPEKEIKATQLTIYQAMNEIENTLFTQLQDLRPHLKKYKQQVETAQGIPAPELEKYRQEICLLEKFEKKCVDGFYNDEFDITSDNEEQERYIPSLIACSSSPSMAMPKPKSFAHLASLTHGSKNNQPKNNVLQSTLPQAGSYPLPQKRVFISSLTIRPKSCPVHVDALNKCGMHDINLNK